MGEERLGSSCCEVPHVIYEERIIEVPQAGWADDGSDWITKTWDLMT
jgi:hypothetical protein